LYEWEIPMGIFFMMWANDSGAYLAGINFGKRKLASAISPNKTWEGLWGGVLLTLIIAYAYSQFSLALSETIWLSSAPVISTFGTLGDLFESKLKRIAGVKDSGKIMPGHGGVLDRFDGLIFVLPVLCLLYKIMLL
jgi:phosphatidate cytidylyltransferase